MQRAPKKPFIAIACGGTGGHLFPGLAVAEEFVARGCDVALLVSRKDVDQSAVQGSHGMEVATLPAVGLSGGNVIRFGWAFWKSLRQCRKMFAGRPPAAVLGMGGFTSAPPIVAASRAGIPAFLHESNTLPGRANRWLASRVDGAFVYFPETKSRFKTSHVSVCGMPVRRRFQPLDAASCRITLGLAPNRPVLLVMGGSQGARGVNDIVLAALPRLATMASSLQYLHLTGPADLEKVRAAYAAAGLKAVVRPFLTEMELALAAATAAISRAGASSLAELAAMRVPAVLVPYPFAADNHQFHNARAFVAGGAARLLEQRGARAEELMWLVLELTGNRVSRQSMMDALARWHTPEAASWMVSAILKQAGLEGEPPVVDTGTAELRESETARA